LAKRQTAYLGLGSNKGNRTFHIAEAVRRIREIPGTSVLRVSSLYETSPVDVQGGPFLNAVAVIQTNRNPHILMGDLQKIESGMGRVRTRHGPEARNIDIDLLLYGDRVVEEKSLTLPHPRMFSRRFVMEPLADLAPDLRIPDVERTVSQLASALRDRFPEQIVVKVGRLE
jgi:2-amino-4-hydroxy-6-hydroxymethyldihydropteridine diphosphokinase